MIFEVAQRAGITHALFYDVLSKTTCSKSNCCDWKRFLGGFLDYHRNCRSPARNLAGKCNAGIRFDCCQNRWIKEFSGPAYAYRPLHDPSTDAICRHISACYKAEVAVCAYNSQQFPNCFVWSIRGFNAPRTRDKVEAAIFKRQVFQPTQYLFNRKRRCPIEHLGASIQHGQKNAG